MRKKQEMQSRSTSTNVYFPELSQKAIPKITSVLFNFIPHLNTEISTDIWKYLETYFVNIIRMHYCNLIVRDHGCCHINYNV